MPLATIHSNITRLELGPVISYFLFQEYMVPHLAVIFITTAATATTTVNATPHCNLLFAHGGGEGERKNRLSFTLHLHIVSWYHKSVIVLIVAAVPPSTSPSSQSS